jgi:hypothetical protein
MKLSDVNMANPMTRNVIILVAIIFVMFAVSLFARFALAADIAAEQNAPVLLTTTCIINGQLFADNASIRIIAVEDNSTFLNTTYMAPIGKGVFSYNQTFNVSGNYLTEERCYYAGNVTAEGSDNITVGAGWLPLGLIVLACVALVAWGVVRGHKKQIFGFLSSFSFILYVIIYSENIYMSVLFLLLGVGVFYLSVKKD